MNYLKLTLKEIKYKLPMALLLYVIFAVIYEFGLNRTYSRIEPLYVAFAMAVSAYLFRGQDEIELLITSRASLKRVFLIRFFSAFLAVGVLPAVHMLFFSIDTYPQRAALTLFTTVLFCSAFGAFWRVMLKTPIAALIFCSVFYMIMLFPSAFSPSTIYKYFRVSPLYSVSLSDSSYMKNRLYVLGYTVILLAASYLKLNKKEII